MEIGSVVASDDAQVANNNGTVAQQVDARIVVELLGTLLSAIEFVITQTCIDGCRQPTELLCHTFLFDGAHTHVDDVTGNKYEIGLLGINHVYPAVEFLTTIMISDVQVADHHQFHGTCQMLAGGQRQLLTIFMLIVQVAVDEDSYHYNGNTQDRPPIII